MDSEIERMVRECQDNEEELTEWEIDFIDALVEQLDDPFEKGPITPAQRSKLEEVYESAVNGHGFGRRSR